MSGYMIAASLNFLCMLTGFQLRHLHRTAHALLMGIAIASDLTLVLILQIQRHAIQTTFEFKLSALNQAHIYASSTATLLYFPMIFLGLDLFFRKSGTPAEEYSRKRNLHRRIGVATLVFRTLGFFLMFSMWGKPH